MKMKIQTKAGHAIRNLTRGKAIRERCFNCSGFSYQEIQNCKIKECHLYSYRMDKSKTLKAIAIRKYCLNCCASQSNEVHKCPASDCSLWAYRKAATDRSVEIKD